MDSEGWGRKFLARCGINPDDEADVRASYENCREAHARWLRTTPDTEAGRRELDLEDITAGGYFTIGRHAFMVQRMNLDVTARAPHRRGGEPERELEEIDMRLVHARWKCCNA